MYNNNYVLYNFLHSITWPHCRCCSCRHLLICLQGSPSLLYWGKCLSNGVKVSTSAAFKVWYENFFLKTILLCHFSQLNVTSDYAVKGSLPFLSGRNFFIQQFTVIQGKDLTELKITSFSGCWVCSVQIINTMLVEFWFHYFTSSHFPYNRNSCMMRFQWWPTDILLLSHTQLNMVDP